MAKEKPKQTSAKVTIAPGGTAAFAAPIAIEPGTGVVKVAVTIPALPQMARPVQFGINVERGGSWYGAQGAPVIRSAAQAQELTFEIALPPRTTAIRLRSMTPLESGDPGNAQATIAVETPAES